MLSSGLPRASRWGISTIQSALHHNLERLCKVSNHKLIFSVVYWSIKICLAYNYIVSSYIYIYIYIYIYQLIINNYINDIGVTTYAHNVRTMNHRNFELTKSFIIINSLFNYMHFSSLVAYYTHTKMLTARGLKFLQIAC